jgi:hypothetical protein
MELVRLTEIVNTLVLLNLAVFAKISRKSKDPYDAERTSNIDYKY